MSVPDKVPDDGDDDDDDLVYIGRETDSFKAWRKSRRRRKRRQTVPLKYRVRLGFEENVSHTPSPPALLEPRHRRPGLMEGLKA
ncbi:hypothetical protein PoB_000902300 [Plakobranchus ocellatus]|uniref:Uncharacterized protein n=1 Tax=Plakobranchus ocellatus TaxID=259542 RepID=A0AAV3YJ26_9GAST|nr:hypothetical protein PoB_000902300 [Plakobranchus ocellatus]